MAAPTPARLSRVSFASDSLQQTQRAGRERLYPSLTNPNYLILRKRRLLFEGWLRAIPGNKLRVFDIGGRLQPYRPLLGQRCERYISVDLWITPLVQVAGDAAHLPLASSSLDLAICTQMLEYVAEPRNVISEIYRVLRPGGYLLLSVPSVFPRDSEKEYWRFLPDAISALLTDFREVEIAEEGNSLVGLIRTINVFLVTFAKPRWFAKLLCHTVVPLINIGGFFLQTVIKSRDNRFSANFSALARK